MVNAKRACVEIAWDDELEKHWCAPVEPADDTPKSLQEYQDELALREELRAKLGAEPGAAVIVDCISTKQSRRLAWRLIQAMFEQWPPCVLRSYWTGPDPVAEEIWTLGELAVVWAETGRLP